jgi:hypothetical protein
LFEIKHSKTCKSQVVQRFFRRACLLLFLTTLRAVQTSFKISTFTNLLTHYISFDHCKVYMLLRCCYGKRSYFLFMQPDSFLATNLIVRSSYGREPSHSGLISCFNVFNSGFNFFVESKLMGVYPSGFDVGLLSDLALHFQLNRLQ